MYRMTGLRFLTVLIGSLLVTSATASDSLMDSREYMTKTYNVLNVDTNGTKTLDTATVRGFVFDAAMKAYSDLGDPRAGKYVITAKTPGVFISEGLIRIMVAILDTNNTYQVLKRIDPAKLSDESYYATLTGTLGRPKFYIRHGDSINLVPPPAKNDTLKVFYFARGPFPYGTKSDTVTITLPAEYRWAVVYAAAGICELRRGTFDKADAFEKLYQQEVARLRTRFELEGITEQ